MEPNVKELVILNSNTIKNINIVQTFKFYEKYNTENPLIQAKVEMEILQTKVNTLGLKIKEQKKLLNNVNLDKYHCRKNSTAI